MMEEEAPTQATCETDGGLSAQEEGDSTSKSKLEVEVILSPQEQEGDAAKDFVCTTPTKTYDSELDHNQVAKNESESEAPGDGGEGDHLPSLPAPTSSDTKEEEDEDGGGEKRKEDEVSEEEGSSKVGGEEAKERKENEGENDAAETPDEGEDDETAEVSSANGGEEDKEQLDRPLEKNRDKAEEEPESEEHTAQEEHGPSTSDNAEPVTQDRASTEAVAAVDRDHGDAAGADGEERDEEGEENREEGDQEEGERAEETKGLHSRSKSKEELVESLLQVMEDIVVARAAAASANAPGITHSRRRSHHPLPNAPLPPLPNGDAALSPRSSQADAAVDGSGASDNHGSKEKNDEPVSSSLSTSSSTTSEATAEDESEDGMLSPRDGMLSPREGSESGSRRAGLMGTRRRPRGPLPPTPGKDSAADANADGHASPSLSSAGSSSADADSHLPRNYNEDGSVRTFVDAVGDKALLESISADEQKRQNVILELITTEKQYVTDLRTLIEVTTHCLPTLAQQQQHEDLTFLHCQVYINPIQEKKLLNKKQMTAIFANVDTIYEINSNLLQELEKRQASETIISRIGDIFVSQADKFKVYAAYCSSQDPRAKKVTKYKQKLPEFKAFCEQAFVLPRCRLLELDSFLIAPLQRVCKYPLLLKETLKNTPEGHEDYNDLKLAKEKVSEVVDRINERTRVVKHVMDLKTIQKKLGQPLSLVERDRYPIREGALQGLRYQSKGKEKDCKGAAYYAFLLNDLFLLCQPTKESTKKEKDRGSHGHGSAQQPPGQTYVIKEQVEIGKAAARRVMKNDESSPMSSPTSSHRKQAKEKLRDLSPTSLTSLFSSSSSSSSSALSSSGVFDGLSPPLSPQSFVGNQFEIVLSSSKSNHHQVKIYRFQTPTKIDADMWLRDFDRARHEHALVLERQRQQDQIDADALAAATTPRSSTLVRAVTSPGSPLANSTTSPTLARSSSSLVKSTSVTTSSATAIPTRHTHQINSIPDLNADFDSGDEVADNGISPLRLASLSSSSSATRVSSSPQLTSHRSSSLASDDSYESDGATGPAPMPPPPPPSKPTSTPRSFFQKHRRRRSNVPDGLSSSPPSSPAMPSSPTSLSHSLSQSGSIACAAGSPLPASAASASSLVLESEVKELKLKLQEAERKLRIAELRIADLAYDNSELKKRLNVYEKTTGSGTVTTSPRGSDSSGAINTSASGSSKGAKAAGAVKRFIPGRRNGH